MAEEEVLFAFFSVQSGMIVARLARPARKIVQNFRTFKILINTGGSVCIEEQQRKCLSFGIEGGWMHFKENIASSLDIFFQ